MEVFQTPEFVAEKLADAYLHGKTNADRIRSMSDEELAEFLTEYRCVHKAPHCRETNCTNCWLDWLREEASE